MAGAATVVSALWSIPDTEVTAEIASGLYERGGKSIAQAMRAMQLRQIEAIRAGGPRRSPVLVGRLRRRRRLAVAPAVNANRGKSGDTIPIS